jgi:hypothetical protein
MQAFLSDAALTVAADCAAARPTLTALDAATNGSVPWLGACSEGRVQHVESVKAIDKLLYCSHRNVRLRCKLLSASWLAARPGRMCAASLGGEWDVSAPLCN